MADLDLVATRQALEKTKEPVELVGLLEGLECAEVTLEDLQRTKIGVAVGKLRKNTDTAVAALSASLVTKWKQLVPAASTSPAASAASAQQPPRKKAKSDESTTPTPEPRSSSSPPSATESGSGADSQQEVDLRTKSREMLAEALGPAEEKDAWKVEEAASLIEDELHHESSGDLGKAYRAKLRTIYLNLKNPKSRELRNALMLDKQSPARVVRMSPQAMAPEEVKKYRSKIADHQMREVQGPRLEDIASQSDFFVCPKCKQRKTTFYEMQTRSADEPMTIFIQCLNCKNRWRQ